MVDINNKVDIITIGCDNYNIRGTLQRRNRLKGIAQQKLISRATKIVDDISIQKIWEEISNKSKFLYVVESPFKANDAIFEFQKEFVSYDDFPDPMFTYIKEEIVNKKWKKCDNPKCDNVIPAANQWSRKCRKCNNGFFRQITRKFNEWKPLWDGNKDAVIERLIEERYLKRAILQKRPDFFHFANGIIIIFESKNKEKTILSRNDVFRTQKYPKLLSMCGYDIDELKIIYNGDVESRLLTLMRDGYFDKYPYLTSFVPVRKYLEKNGLFVREVIVKRDDDSGYHYEIVEGFSNQIVINLNGICEGDNGRY